MRNKRKAASQTQPKKAQKTQDPVIVEHIHHLGKSEVTTEVKVLLTGDLGIEEHLFKRGNQWNVGGSDGTTTELKDAKLKVCVF